MANEFVARNGIIALDNSQVSGSLNVSGGITGSLLGTASFSISSSYSVSASHAESSSYAITASYVTGSIFYDGNMALSASYAVSASYAFSSSYGATSSYAVTFNVSQSFTASGLRYPTADNGEFSFIQTDGAGTLSLQYVKTMYETIINGETTTIVKGTPLYISGSQGANSIAYRADAANPAKMPVVYIAADNIAPAAEGRGIVLGLITGVDTTGYPGGTEIYVAAGGGWTSTRPTGSAIVQVLGYVTKEGNGGQGVVLNPGPANLPNLNSGSVWLGNSGSAPIAVPSSSLFVTSGSHAITSSYAISSSHAITSSYSISSSYAQNGFPFTGSAEISGSLTVSDFVSLGSYLQLNPGIDPGTSNLSASYWFVTSSADNTEQNLQYRNNGALWEQHWLEEVTTTGIVWGGVVTFSGTTLFVTPGAGLLINYNASTGSHGDTVATYIPFGPITASAQFITSSQVTRCYCITR